MSSKSLNRFKMDRVNEEVMCHIKNSGYFDKVRGTLMLLIESHSDYKYIEEEFRQGCNDYVNGLPRSDGNLDRRVLRAKLQTHVESLKAIDHVRDLIKKMIREKDDDIKTEYISYAETYLKERFLKSTPQDTYMDMEMDIDMDIASEEGSPKAPEFSPISNVEEIMDVNDVENEGSDNERLEGSDNEKLEKLTFSSVSSVNTADLSDFDESIKLSDDEANIVGQPRNSKIPIKVLQGTICDLQTQTEQRQEPSETGSLRATRKRKSNPRYINEHYTY